MKLYVKVTQDKYQLPIFVGNIHEVAAYDGVTEGSIRSHIKNVRKGRVKTVKYVVVDPKENGDD